MRPARLAKVIALLLVVFASGVLVGVAVDRHHLRTKARRIQLLPPEERAHMLLESMRNVLHLTPEQDVAVSAIMREWAADVRAHPQWNRMQRWEQFNARYRERVRAELNPQQTESFDRVAEMFMNRARRER